MGIMMRRVWKPGKLKYSFGTKEGHELAARAKLYVPVNFVFSFTKAITCHNSKDINSHCAY
jgi:hypothetical protein